MISGLVNNDTFKHLLLLVVFGAIQLSVYTGVLNGVGKPQFVRSDDPLAEVGKRPSGEFGWNVLKNITSTVHPYNSLENIRVRDFLIETVYNLQSEFNTWNCSQPNPLQILTDDPINLAIHGRSKNIYYQSDNVLARINGGSSDALLISSHFDSALQSHGATDAGVGIASMATTLRSALKHACTKQLKNSLVFNFNNGEEIHLLGGSTFPYHPWFSNVKAFINLEGTGASETGRSALFRTNSYSLVSLLGKTSPYPHMSSTLNNAMRFIGSDTDYRPYATLGKLPGVDVAFYQNRYLYHTPLDDLQHTSKVSLQHMSENLLSAVYTIDESDYLQKKFEQPESDGSPEGLTGQLFVPSFIYYDKLGVFGISETQKSFIIGMGLMVLVSLIVLVIKLTISNYFTGSKSMVRQIIKPSINSIGLVFTSFIMVVLFNFLFSWIRTLINPGFTYGRPEWSLFSIFSLTFAIISFVEYCWPKLPRVRRMHNNSVQYRSLPTHVVTEGISETTPLTENIDNGDLESIDSLQTSPEPVNGAPPCRSMGTWLPIGLSAFWLFAVVLNLVLSSIGFSMIYIVNDLAFYSLLSVILTLAIETLVRRLVRDDIEFEFTNLQQNFVNFYQNHFWIIQFLLSTTLPFLFSFDVLSIMLVSLPSLIAEKIPDYLVDLVLTLVVWLFTANLMPILSRTNRKYSALFFFGLFIIVWIPQLFVFPYSRDRPFKYVYFEEWDITNSSTSALTEISFERINVKWFDEIRALGSPLPAVVKWDPDYPSFTFKSDMVPKISSLPAKELIQFNLTTESTKSHTIYTGSLIGTPDSRICDLEYLTYSNTSSLRIIEPTIYTIYGTNQTEPMVPLNGTNIAIYSRSFTMGHRQNIPIIAKLSKGDEMKLTLTCYHQLIVSRFYDDFITRKPEWTLESGGSGVGELIVKKSVSIAF
ncbi:hypothetical protein BC833DRAFT_523100 [Globomyces pollinis-pini]|nr:hypothetical protein BC833DRAFT_523100 [Globomyces pollinis-pini]